MQASSTSKEDSNLEDRTGPALESLFDELNRSLDEASKVVRAHARASASAPAAQWSLLEIEPLQRAREKLGQALAVMDQVGLTASAKVLRATQLLLEKLEQEPARCKDDVASKLENVSTALVDYLGRTLKENSASSMARLPQSRDVQALQGEQRAHPADLWSFEWHWMDIVLPVQEQALAYDRQLQTRIDDCLLRLIRSGDTAAARALFSISLGFVAAQNGLQPRLFWQVCAAYFEAVSLGLLAVDTDGKRALSGILRQYRSLAAGGDNVSERLMRELLFALAQPDPVQAAVAPALLALRQAYGLTGSPSLEGERPEVTEQVKVVGSLRIDISAFNTFLNEADEWSRCLFVELSEWALELHRTLAPGTLARAHALAESSASIGLQDLSALADALEQALRHVQGQTPALPQHVKVFMEAADDIRRLLHQFAAGFLKQPEPRLLEALSEILRFEIANSSVGSQDAKEPDLLGKFAEQAVPLLVQLGGALRQWLARPDNVGARNEAVRVLLTLENDARLAGAKRFHEKCQHLSASIDRLGLQALQTAQIEPLFADYDGLKAELHQLQPAHG